MVNDWLHNIWHGEASSRGVNSSVDSAEKELVGISSGSNNQVVEGQSSEAVGSASSERIYGSVEGASGDSGSKSVGNWDSGFLRRLLGAIGAIKGVRKDAMCDWVVEKRKCGVGQIFLGTGFVGDTDPAAWEKKGFVVGYGDGSAEDVADKRAAWRVDKKCRGSKGRAAKVTRVNAAKPEWDGGFGVACEMLKMVENATRAPAYTVLGVPTINVCEGLALLSFIASCPAWMNIAYMGDSKVWSDWCGACKRWVDDISKSGDEAVKKLGKQFRKLKLLILLVTLMRTGSTAVGKVKSHVGIWGNERADDHANEGRMRFGEGWEWLEDVDWAIVTEVVGELADLRQQVEVSIDTDGVFGDGKIIQVVNQTGARNTKALRNALFPFFKRTLRMAEDEWQMAVENGTSLFAVCDKWYQCVSETIFQEAELIMGSKRPGTGGSGQRQTKEFKEHEAVVTKAKHAVAMCERADGKWHKVQEVDMTQLLEWSGELQPPCSARQLQVCIEKAKTQLCSEKEQLDIKRKDDSREARKKGMYAASMQGAFRSLKLLAKGGDSGGIEIEVEDFVEAHKSIHVLPDAWVDDKWHMKSQAELWEIFGSPSGSKCLVADEKLRREYERGEYLDQLKGKRELSRPGIDGIPFAVKSMLVKSNGIEGDLNVRGKEECVDMADVDLYFYNKFRATKEPFTLWKQVVDFILRKGGKDDYKKVNSYRNISLAVVSRKMLGGIWWQRFIVWLQECGKMGNMQVFGRKTAGGGKFPGIGYAVRLLSAVISAAMHFKLNLLILMLDLNSLYPRMLRGMIFTAMLWLDVPWDMIEEFLAFNGDSEATVAKAGKLMDSCKYPILGCFQGCSSSVKLMIIVTIMICQQVEDADAGFVYPWGEIGSDVPQWGYAEQSTPGVGFADDIVAFAGGGWNHETRLSIEETEVNMNRIGRKMLKVLHGLGAPAGATKTILTGVLYSDAGERVHPDLQLMIFAETGYETVKMIPLEDGLLHLGVRQDVIGQRGVFTNTLEKQQESAILQLALDPDIPRKALMDMWFVSELGKWKYCAPKMDCSRKEAKRARMLSSKVVRKLLKSSGLPNSAMYAYHKDFGLGLMDPQEFLLKASAHGVMAMARCEEGWMRSFFWFFLQATRTVNKVGLISEPDEFVFFNWDVQHTCQAAVSRWKWQNEFVTLLGICKDRELVVCLSNDCRQGRTGGRAEWCVKGNQECLQQIRAMGEAVTPAAVTKMMAVWFRLQQAAELKCLKSAGELARLKNVNAALSNRWKKAGVVSLNVWIFMVKASFRMVATPVWKFVRGLTDSAVCPLCRAHWCNLKHVLSCCECLTSRLYSWRHQLVVRKVSKVLCKHWEVVSQEQDAVIRWLGRNCEIGSHHSRPDITLRSVVAGKGVRCRIIDVAVAYDEDVNMENAAIQKKEKYEFLRRAIKEGAGIHEAVSDVEVVPIVIGVLGTIPADWYQTMASLQVGGDQAKSLAEDIHGEVTAASHWIWTRFCRCAFGGMGLHELAPRE